MFFIHCVNNEKNKANKEINIPYLKCKLLMQLKAFCSFLTQPENQFWNVAQIILMVFT